MTTNAPVSSGELRMVPTDQVLIPDLRASALYNEELETELVESIARQGILQPIQVDEVDGKLWLVDGLHRLAAARQLGMAEVPCIVKPGDQAGVLIKNLITSRQKGRSNPGEEARVIRSLREDGGMPLEKIAQITGISIGWARKLHDVSYLPKDILDLVSHGKLGISHAMELCRLNDADLQRELADQCVEWHYTTEQAKIRVEFLLRPPEALVPGGYQFDTRGQPSRVPIPCAGCRVDLTGNASYLFMCGDCQLLYFDFLEAYRRQEAPPAPSDPAGAAPAVVTDTPAAD